MFVCTFGKTDLTFQIEVDVALPAWVRENMAMLRNFDDVCL